MEGLEKKSLGGRIASLDALRGFDMFWIIGGDAICRSLPAIKNAPLTRLLARQVEHNPWAGFTFYDLIFPLFLFIIGAVFPFSLLKRIEEGESKKRLYFHIVKRSLILILLGLMAGGCAEVRFRQYAVDGRSSANRVVLFPGLDPCGQHEMADPGREFSSGYCSSIGRRRCSFPFPISGREI